MKSIFGVQLLVGAGRHEPGAAARARSRAADPQERDPGRALTALTWLVAFADIGVVLAAWFGWPYGLIAIVGLPASVWIWLKADPWTTSMVFRWRWSR
jgi:hypothetical protein